MSDTTQNTGATGPDDSAGAATPQELLQAGAVLPVGTADAGEHAAQLTARSYRHGGLEGRTVVRLVAAELGPAEDAAAGFLGLEPAAEPAVVGLGLRQELGFPEWVLVHYPEDGSQALAVVPELDRLARQAKSKPKAAFDGYQALAKQLAAAVPHFLPTFYEQAGRVFVGMENATYAAQMFSRARAADAEFGLRIDEDRLDAVFLEFALAGALSVKVLAAYGRELITRLPPTEALERFTRLCVRRTAGGMTPSAQMATELRKLAKAAGSDADAVEQRYLAELLGLSATLHAPTGWWKAHRPALVAVAQQDPKVRRMLLDVMPVGHDKVLAETWLGVLVETGAAEALYDPAQPEEQRPADGALGWLRRFEQLRGTGWWRSRGRMPELYPLVEKCAPRLREELAQEAAAAAQAPPEPAGQPRRRSVRVPGTFEVPEDVDLLDLLLALDLPVADPGRDLFLRLDAWAEGEGQRDLRALAADQRFRPAFHEGVQRLSNSGGNAPVLRTVSATPGGREMLAETVAAIAWNFSVAGLPDLPDAIKRLSWLPGEVLALAEDAVRAAARTDLAPVLARTLRAGLFDELCWPDWDKAVAELISSKEVRELSVMNAWPYLIVSGPAQVRVLGAEGTVLTHDLRIPQGDQVGRANLCYVDDELLVYWHSRTSGDRSLRGYWHKSADQIHPIESRARLSYHNTMNYYTVLPPSLPIPGGGRTTGGDAPIHRGDTVVPENRHLLGDGRSFWVYTDDNGDSHHRWREFDPATGKVGRASVPGFVSDVTREAPEGSSFTHTTLLPAPLAEAGPAARPVDGVYGWSVVTRRDGTVQGREISGLTVSVPAGRRGHPARALMFPGADKPTVLMHGQYTLALIDPDGVTTSTTRTDARPVEFARGTALLPPVEFWHFMRARDSEGSAALRLVDRDGAAALLKSARKRSAVDETRSRVNALVQGANPADVAAAEQDRVAAKVRVVLPQVTDEALIAGISGVVQYAATQQLALDDVAKRLETALTEKPRQPIAPTGPTDELLCEPLRSLGADRQYWSSANYEIKDAAFQQVRLIGQARRAPGTPFPPGKLHVDGTLLPWPSSGWWGPMLGGWSALAYRAASPATEPETAAGLLAFLREFDDAGLAASTATSPWRLRSLQLAEQYIVAERGNPNAAWRSILPQADGAFIAFFSMGYENSDGVFGALHYDPAGQFAVPAPYQARMLGVVGEERPEGWLAAFLAQLAERGPVPWFPEAAPEFARLTGITPTQAALVVAGLPRQDNPDNSRSFLTPEVRKLLGVKSPDSITARDTLRRIPAESLRRVLAALVPGDPARLWTEGPDVAAAAEVWNRLFGKSVAVPEWLLTEAQKAASFSWHLPTLLDPARSPALSNDLPAAVSGDRVRPVDDKAVGFNEKTLTGAVAAAAWLAHRLPAGSPQRAALPAALEAVRARVAYPELLLSLGSYANLPAWRKSAGTPTEVGQGYERYGAVIMATHDNRPIPAVKVALLDEAGEDPYLHALREIAPDPYTNPARVNAQDPFPVIAALRLAGDPAFARLMQDPGEPAAGERDADGTWAPQDPSRSVPDLVVEAAKEYGLGEDAAALYLMLLAMPDPTDQNTRRWTGWKAPRMAAAHAELAATDLVIEGVRARAKRTLFLPGAWTDQRAALPFEQWKLPLLGGMVGTAGPLLNVLVPAAPVAEVYREAWRRIGEGDTPRFGELKVRSTRGRRR